MSVHCARSSGRGAFVVLEGLDRSGKTTQSHLLLQKLQSLQVPAELIRFPDRSVSNPVGRMLTEYLSKSTELDHEVAHMLFTMQRFSEKKRMRELLENGTTLIVDRYAHSGIAYSVAKGLDLEWCKQKESGLLQPDVVIYMDLPPEEGQKRGGYGQERFEIAEFQQKVYHAYERIRDDSWKVVSATDKQETIFDTILKLTLSAMDQSRSSPLSLLYPMTLPTQKRSFSPRRIATQEAA